MRKQTDINAKMRSILFDWLVEVHMKFKLVPETLFMTCGLIDRYLEKEQVMRDRLQLVGIAAMFIASKYEEIFAPEYRSLVESPAPLGLAVMSTRRLGLGLRSSATRAVCEPRKRVATQRLLFTGATTGVTLRTARTARRTSCGWRGTSSPPSTSGKPPGRTGFRCRRLATRGCGWLAQPAAHCSGARQSHNAGSRPQHAARSAPRLTTPNALVFLRRFVKAACPARSPAAPRSQPELHAPRVDTYNTAHRAPPLAGGQSTSHALWEATAPCSLLRLPPYCCPLPRQARTLPGRADAARV